MPTALAGLDADTRDLVLSLAVEIVTAPQPIDGLTPQQAKLVQVLRAVPGRWVGYGALAQATASDMHDPPQPLSISTALTRMRGHPARACIETTGGGRGWLGQARWVG